MYTGISRLECKNHTLFVTKMAKISLNWYPIYDQNNRKTIPFGSAHTYIVYIREYPPPGECLLDHLRYTIYTLDLADLGFSNN